MSSAQAPGGQRSPEGARAESTRGGVDRTSSDADRVARAKAPKDDPLLGRTIAGKYTITELIGEGAMGRVYRAKQTALDKAVALKVLHRHLSGEERIAKRFHREARAASRLSHPNSMQILDFGATDDGTLYIAMELLDGEDLQTIVDHDFPFAPTRIAAILVPVLRALEEAHRAGVIHRDLKPENVVVLADRSGREHVKVCDFGIAKILDGEEGTSITVDGFVCGTPQYMAPEQARGDDIDPRSDIYAAGVVLYVMLCGVLPFTGENTLGIITKHLMEEPVPPRRRRPDLGIPKVLEAVCLKAMRKDPDERYPTAAAMADALDAAVRSLGADASARLGEGPWRAEPTDEIDRDARAARERSTRSLERIAIPKRRASAIGIAIALLGVLIGAAAWWTSRTADGVATPRAARPRPESASETGAEAAPAAHAAPTPETGAVSETVAATDEATDQATVETETAETAAGAEAGRAAATGAAAPPAAQARRHPRERGGATTGSAAAAATTPAVQTSSSVEEAPTTVADTRSAGEIAFADGRRLFLGNDVPGAIARFEEAARLMPRSAEVQKQLGRAYMRAGDRDRSVAAYRRYLTLAPDAPDREVVERIIAQHGG